MKFLLASPWLAVYEGEEVVVDPVPDPVVKDDNKPTLTQNQVNKILAEERRKYQAEREKQVVQLQELQKTAGLTAKQKADLEVRIEELNTVNLTKEEQAKREKERLETDYKKQLTTTVGERDNWKTRFTDSQIKREIVDAATQNDGFAPDQFVNQLFPNTRLVEVLDEAGQPSGQYEAKVKFPDLKEGKPITLDLTVPEAVKRMKEMDKFHNFFKSNLQSGLGAGRAPGTSNQKDFKKMTSDDYAEAYKSLKKR